MWFILGIFGTAIMALIELIHVTDIGYWWSLLPTGIGIILQLGGGDILENIFD